MKTILGLLVLVVVCTLLGAWYWTSGGDKGPEFRTLPVDRDELLIAISATGTVEPVEVVDVGAQIVGRISSFAPDPESKSGTVDYGSKVREGELLAQLDDSSVRAERDKAQASLKLAQADLTRTRAQLEQAKQDFERAERLRSTNSEREYEIAFAQYEIAKADVEIGLAHVEQAEITKEVVEINLGYTTITAPIDGVVIDRHVNVGQTVVAGLNAPSLFLLARDLSRLQVLAAVNEADIGEVSVGQNVTFRVDAYRETTFAGKVTQVRLNAGMSHNVVTYDVVVDIDNTDGKLLPYMTANLQFEVARQSDVILIPNQALRWRPTPEQITPSERSAFSLETADDGTEKTTVAVDSPTVWVPTPDGRVRPVSVTVGLSDGMVSESTGAEVQSGDVVVVSVKREATRDFVSSFVSRVTRSNDKQ